MVGGPRDWREHPRLLRVYTLTTLVGVALHAVNLALRGVAYLADQPAVLAALGVAAATGVRRPRRGHRRRRPPRDHDQRPRRRLTPVA